ncbi:MAG: PepSY-like domain-containing protein [Bacteroidia bacterium]|nr:PepSY-like domain-containing protein [Bacteroidia bacterium]
MKKLITALLTSFFFLQLAFAQTEEGNSRGLQTLDVPAVILDAFGNNFPDAVKVSWRRINQDYLAKFMQNGHSMQAVFTDAGIWKYTDIEVREDLLKDRIRQHILNYYPDAVFRKISLHDESGKSFYSIEIQTGGIRKTLRYSDKGVLLD